MGKLTEKEKDEAVDALRINLAEQMDDCLAILHEAGLDTISKITVVARDPDNPDMFFVVSNEECCEEVAKLLIEQRIGASVTSKLARKETHVDNRLRDFEAGLRGELDGKIMGWHK